MNPERGVVFVAKQHSLQNDLLVCHIDEVIGLKCVSIDGLDNFRSAEAACSDHLKLVLLDCLGLQDSTILESVQFLAPNEPGSTTLALMNLNAETAVEKRALGLGIHGFFYEHDSIELLLKGINAIMSGEVWITRKKMLDCLTREKSNSQFIVRKQSILTRREEEILRLLSRGGTNDSIAEELCISPHTVRTHNYNIFKKIDVPNRLQASLWAAKYL